MIQALISYRAKFISYDIKLLIPPFVLADHICYILILLLPPEAHNAKVFQDMVEVVSTPIMEAGYVSNSFQEVLSKAVVRTSALIIPLQDIGFPRVFY